MGKMIYVGGPTLGSKVRSTIAQVSSSLFSGAKAVVQTAAPNTGLSTERAPVSLRLKSKPAGVFKRY